MTFAELMNRAKLCAEGSDNSYEKGLVFAELAKAEAIMNLSRVLKVLIPEAVQDISDSISTLGDKLEK